MYSNKMLHYVKYHAVPADATLAALAAVLASAGGTLAPELVLYPLMPSWLHSLPTGHQQVEH